MQELKRHVDDYWHTYQKLKHIDLPVAVLQHLAKLGYEIWVVTGSPTEFLLPLLKKLPVTRIIGMDFEVDTQGIITGQRTGICCAGPGKAEKVKSLWQSPVQFAAGNALLDEAMLRIARDVAWVVHPHPELERIAKQEGWDILPAEHPPYGTAKSWPSLAEELAERGLPTPKEVKK
jgi:phosphoserine phosphatase